MVVCEKWNKTYSEQTKYKKSKCQLKEERIIRIPEAT